ncbi:MAG: hypothetical protein JWO31_124, partial [Phycisphaerales bacterium]|nr:hypothetical protein [Phycisphaerales bacterium]
MLDADGDGLAGASDPRTTTGADGRYAFENVAPGRYAVLLTSRPGWDAAGAQARSADVGSGQVVTGLDFQVRPPAPTPATATAQGGTESGSLATWTLGAFAAGGSTGPWQLLVDWGDNTSLDAVVAAAPGAIVLSHAYADQGTYAAAVRATSAEGGTAEAVVPVTIDNAPPTAVLAGPATVPVGDPAAFALSNARDASPADAAAGLRFSFDFDNDGDFVDPGDVVDAAGPSAAYAFPAVGTYTVRGRVADKDGGYSDYTASVVVTPPPSPPPPVTVSLSLRSPADAFVKDGSFSNTNYGTNAALEVRRSSIAGNQREAYLRFDLAGVSAAGQIATAVLRLYWKLSEAGSVNVGLYPVASSAWTEAGLKSSIKPTAGTAAIATKTLTGTANAWVEFDVTSYLKQQKAAGASSVSLAMKATNYTTPYVTFASDEAAANRPELRVTQQSTPPSPPAPPVTPQAIVVSAAAATVPEGKSVAVTVKLAAQPSATVTVAVA